MSAGLEYTKWHLTATGWVRGTAKTDSTYESKERPAAALATFVYSEEISYSGPADEKIIKEWVREGENEEVAFAIASHGECPRCL